MVVIANQQREVSPKEHYKILSDFKGANRKFFGTEKKQFKNGSLSPSARQLTEIESKRYQDVRKSVKQHLKKYSNLVPNMKKHKLKLMNEILEQEEAPKIPKKRKLKKPKMREIDTDQGVYVGQDRVEGFQNQSKTPSHSHRYETHKGPFQQMYVQLGGLGFNKDKKWDQADERRRNMLNFSHKVYSKPTKC